MKVMPLVDLEDVATIAAHGHAAEGYDWYLVSPSSMYPAVIAWIRETLDGQHDVPASVRLIFDEARQLGTGDGQAGLKAQPWEDALAPIDPAHSAKRRQLRDAALEAARRIFTALLREQNGGPIGVHIERDAAYKLHGR